MRITDVSVNKKLLELAKQKDSEALAALREAIVGLVLYDHILHIGPDDVIVSIEELELLFWPPICIKIENL